MRPVTPLLGIALCFICFARAEGSPVSKEARECFEWFQTLGYPDVENAPWAEVWTGSYAGSVPPKALTLHGFITKSDGEKFAVLTEELIPFSLSKTQPDTAAHQRVGYEKQPFHSYAAGLLENLRRSPRDERARFGPRLGVKARVFFLAYACWVKGDVALAQQLFDEAKKLPSYQNAGGGEMIEPMRLALEVELAHSAMWQAVLLFGDFDNWRPRGSTDVKFLPRRELLGVFRNFVRHYPQSPHIARAKETVRILEQMVKEDEQHPALSDEALEKLPVEDQVKELILRLRDQNGHQFSQPGMCDIFDGFGRPGGDTAAHRLVKIGYPAVPQLIEALGDERFSRSVGFQRDFCFSHHVLTIGDCAQQILNQIAARSFYTRRTSSSYMSRDNEVSATRKNVEDWWKEFQAKGEKETLVEGIASGQQDPTPLILRLMDKYPDAIEGAVLAGAANASNEWFMQSYINAAGTLKTASAADWLRSQMKEAKTLRIRISAGRQLWNQGDSTALPAMIGEWQRFTPDSKSRLGGDGLDSLVDFLITSGDASAMNALAKGWDQRGINERFEVVKKLGERLQADKREPLSLASKKPDAAAMDVAESLLAHALEDTAVRTGMSGSYGDYHFSDPRICDFALWSLHRIFPDRYVFSPVAEVEQRDNERITAANAWRCNHHQPELPTPATASKTESQPN